MHLFPNITVILSTINFAHVQLNTVFLRNILDGGGGGVLAARQALLGEAWGWSWLCTNKSRSFCVDGHPKLDNVSQLVSPECCS